MFIALDWIIDSSKRDDDSDYTINLLILSEKEFLSEYETQEDFQEMLDSAVVVYDVDAEFVLKNKKRLFRKWRSLLFWLE